MTAPQVRRRTFAEHVASGKSGAEAARLAGYKGTDASLRNQACRLMTNDDVRKIIEEHSAACTTARVLTATERRELLTLLACKSDEDTRDRIAAVRELNAMDGLHIKKVEHSGIDGEPINALIATIPTAIIEQRLAELATRKRKS